MLISAKNDSPEASLTGKGFWYHVEGKLEGGVVEKVKIFEQIAKSDTSAEIFLSGFKLWEMRPNFSVCQRP